MGQEILGLWESHSTLILGLAKNVISAAAILIIGVILSRGARKLIKKADEKRLQGSGSVSSLLQALVRYGIIIICVIMVLNVFGVNTASLIAILGAAGVAIGLALKDTLGNIASGIILLVLGSYREGEYIEFGSYSGTVKEVNLFTTILETPDGIYVSAPNSAIWGAPLKNYTRNGKRRMELSFVISYKDSVETAFQVMRNIIAQEPRFLTEPAPQVILQSIELATVRITVRAWASIKDYWDIYWTMSRLIKEKFEESGLHIPLPQQDIHLNLMGQKNPL